MFNKNQHSGFTTPKEYFENFEASLQRKLRSGNEAQDVNLPKNDGFVVPEDYFNKVKIDLKARMSAKNSPRVIPLRRLMAIAASFLLLFGVYILTTYNAEEPADFTDLTQDELDAYFDASYWNLNDSDLAEIVPEDEIENSEFLKLNLGDAQLLDYLDTHVGDVEELKLDTDE